MARIIIPIGKSLGPIQDEKKDIDHFELLIGGEIEDLTELEWGTWNVAHSDTDAHRDLKFDRERLISTTLDITDSVDRLQIEEAIRKLLAVGAIVEIEPKDGELEKFFKQHLMVPSAIAHGSSPEDPDLFRIGDASGDWADVDGWERPIWAVSFYYNSMWYICEQLAENSEGESSSTVAMATLPSILILNSLFLGHLEPAR
ncbi:hypothetical protein [Haloglycomyces albus]|uniref:hypothetical protein n=1 Tax=Haloglycomyces albus TaxID=526067 RepID=UPI00046D579A|nr:hypothetical protein [Haloglycomyces albus]